MRRKCLLGANKYNEIVFGNFEVTHRDGYPEFTASFDTVRPFCEANIDLEDYYIGYLENLSDAEKYRMCENFDCSPSQLADELARNCYDVRDAIDCSLYPEWHLVDGESWYFESCSCGQHDTRNEMEIYTNKEAYDLLHELWDKYHLKELDNEGLKQVENLVEMFDDESVLEEAWIIDYIENELI